MEVQNYVVRGGISGDFDIINTPPPRASTAWDKVEIVHLFNRHFGWRGGVVMFAMLMLIVYCVGFYIGANRPLPAPPWERAPKIAPPANHPELRRPLRRVRLAWDAVGNFNSEKSLMKFGRALELFSADLDKHQPGELGIAPADYAAIKGDIARLRGNAAAVASAIETIKANENTGVEGKKEVRA